MAEKQENLSEEEISLRLAFRLKEQEQIEQFNADRDYALRLDRELNGQAPVAPPQVNVAPGSPNREDLDYIPGAPPRPLGVHEHYPQEVQVPRQVYQPPAQPAYQPPAQPAYQPPVYQPPVQPAYQPPAYQPPANTHNPPQTNSRNQPQPPANHSAILDDDDFNWSLS